MALFVWVCENNAARVEAKDWDEALRKCIANIMEFLEPDYPDEKQRMLLATKDFWSDCYGLFEVEEQQLLENPPYEGPLPHVHELDKLLEAYKED
jgi:hypothetical protein